MANSQTKNLGILGDVKVSKKRGLKRINMRLHHSGEVRVSIPNYLPYASGFAFAKSHSDWIDKQRKSSRSLKIYPEMQIGKGYKLIVLKADKISTRVKTDSIVLYVPEDANINDAEVLLVAKKAIKRALSKEAKDILPERVKQLAKQYSYTYEDVKTKPMKARWGSCSSQKVITLNIYLLMMPWPIIDYVILHELAHTKHMNHSKAFWDELASTVPNYKSIKKEIKTIQSDIHALYC